MKIAVFTNQFPAKACTFMARDIAALNKNGILVDIHAFYPYDDKYWKFVPKIIYSDVFSKKNVFHLKLFRFKSFYYFFKLLIKKPGHVISKCFFVYKSSIKFGAKQFFKTLYVSIKAIIWSEEKSFSQYDHIMAYWGNYAGTLAYLLHHLCELKNSSSIFLHAGTDLYRDQIILKEKLLYADLIFTECDYNIKYIEKMYPELKNSRKLLIHYNGIDIENFRFNHDRETKKILAVGGLSKYKGFDFLLKAIGILVDKGLNIQLELVGEGAEMENLLNLSKSLNLGKHFKLTKWIPFEDVKKKMSKCTIFIHPSAGDGDCTPNVLKESMATGSPVIASNVSGIPEVLEQGKSGRLVPTKNIKELAKNIEQLLMDDDARINYSNSGRKWIEKTFNMWKNGEKMACAIKDIRNKTTSLS
tara:strand:+ start:662 stop:1906 length:1245 start_codon:yes stop_codon:yes gene_type:complete